MPNLIVRHGSKFTVSSTNAVQVISEKGKGELFIVFVPVSATLDACVLAFRITQNVQAEFGLAKVNILPCYVVELNFTFQRGHCDFCDDFGIKSTCIAPIHETSLRRSDIARIVKHALPAQCTPCISSASGMSYTCLCLPSRS